MRNALIKFSGANPNGSSEPFVIIHPPATIPPSSPNKTVSGRIV